jgi:2-amino-4-hydroxy-6-hydroxymethyldihydropteridine diphosphokinase
VSAPLYILGLGSDIEPERNIARALEALVARFGPIHVSHLARTTPVGVPGEAPFINGAAALRSTLPEGELKAWCNAQETAQGRDRTNPRRKTLPRPLDLDILLRIDDGAPPPPDALPREPYARPFVLDLLAHLGLGPTPPWRAGPRVTITALGHPLGDRATLIADHRQGSPESHV